MGAHNLVASSRGDTAQPSPCVLTYRSISSLALISACLSAGLRGGGVGATGTLTTGTGALAGSLAASSARTDSMSALSIQSSAIGTGASDIGKTTDRKSTRLNSSH